MRFTLNNYKRHPIIGTPLFRIIFKVRLAIGFGKLKFFKGVLFSITYSKNKPFKKFQLSKSNGQPNLKEIILDGYLVLDVTYMSSPPELCFEHSNFEDFSKILRLRIFELFLYLRFSKFFLFRNGIVVHWTFE